MIQKGNFLLLELAEFRDWLQKQKITRNIKGLQVHHTASPNYSTRKMTNGVALQDHFACLEGMRNFHINTNKWSATGQHLTIFEDGKIGVSLDRSLNTIPAGIKNNNSGYICIENIGNFDRGQDVMTTTQKQAIAHVYASLCEKFHIAVNTDKIVYHGWYTSSGTRLSDYTPGKSSKTCPGTAFWGDGNTIAAANKGFIPAVKAELERLRNGDEVSVDLTIERNKIYKERIYLANGSLVRCDGNYKVTATDVRYIKFPTGKVEYKFVYEKGAKVSDLVKKYKADYGFNAPFFHNGSPLGDVKVGDKVISGAYGKMLKWHEFAVKENKPVIGQLNKAESYDFLIQGSPLLVENGQLVYEKYRVEQEVNDDIGKSRCQRTFVGIDKNGDLILFVGDGRTSSDQGLTLQEAAMFAQSKGCLNAINFDGGGSTIFADKTGGINQKLNTGVNERIVNHAVLVYLDSDKGSEKLDNDKVVATITKVDLIEKESGRVEEVDALIANGVTYAAVRQTGNYFEAEVGYDSKRKRASLTK